MITYVKLTYGKFKGHVGYIRHDITPRVKLGIREFSVICPGLDFPHDYRQRALHTFAVITEQEFFLLGGVVK